MKLNVKRSQFLIVVGGALLLAVIGYLLFQNSQLRQKLTPPTPPTVVPLNIESTLPAETNKDNSESKPPTKQVTRLTYSLPSGWKTVQDASGTFEIGYDPNLVVVKAVEDKYIYLTRKTGLPGTILNITLLPYDGGSRHAFISKQLNQDLAQLGSDYNKEGDKDYAYDGRSGLVLYNFSVSQIGIIGMMDAGQGQAFYFSGYVTQAEMEQYIQTLKLLK